MAKIEEVFQKTAQDEIITELKSKRYTNQPDTGKAKNQLDPLKHDVFDAIKRPDKRVKIDTSSNDETAQTVVSADNSETATRIERVARIGVALQKLIVKRAVAFLFGNDVTINAVPDGDKEIMVFEALKKILKDNKSVSLNRKVARHVFSVTEAAELWYPIPVDKSDTGSKFKNFIKNITGNKTHSGYGFESKFKLRSAILSPLNGDTLYPYFDETGDMQAFSREYQRTDDNKVTHTFFETYTAVNHFQWEMKTEGWVLSEGYPKKIEIGKIPIVYAYQESVEWEDVQNLIDRLERLLSNFADTIDYHASPKIFVKGELTGFSKKGEAGSIIEGDAESDAKYLAWEYAPEAVKLEITTLLNLIYTLTQTPDISFESVKGIGAVSGIALKLLFLDAHLKVKDKQEIFDEYMQRRVSVIKAFIAKFNTSLAAECESLDVQTEITPYMIEDEKTKVEILTTANGSKPLISKKLAAKLSGLAQDPDEDFKQMEEESKTENTFSIGEPTE